MSRTTHGKRPRAALAGRGFSLIELLVVILIILIIAAIAIPNLLRSRIAANESSAVSNLRTISTAAMAYNSTYGNGYPPSLASLGGTAVVSTCDLAVLLDSILATAPYVKTGYVFAYTGDQGNVTAPPGCANPGFVGYLVTASPVSVLTGVRSFCADEPGVIHYDVTGAIAASAAACDALPGLQ